VDVSEIRLTKEVIVNVFPDCIVQTNYKSLLGNQLIFSGLKVKLLLPEACLTSPISLLNRHLLPLEN